MTRKLHGLLAVVIVIGSANRLIADDNAAPADELTTVLGRWQQAFADVQWGQVRFLRFTYDTVFETEQRGAGVIGFDERDRFRFDLRPAEIPADVRSQRIGKTGRPYTLKEEATETWIWTNTELRRICPAEKTCEVYPYQFPQGPGKVQPVAESGWFQQYFQGLSQPMFGYNILLRANTEALRKQYDIELLEHGKTSIRLKLIDRDAANHPGNQAFFEILLNPVTSCPQAIKLVDPTGNTETVYVFRDWEFDEAADWATVSERNLKGPPFAPSLDGYENNEMRIRQ